MLTDEQIQAIRARADAATPGPWRVDDEEGGAGIIVVGPRRSRGADAAFIARAREDVPALLAALEESRAEAARLRNALTDCALYGRGATSRKARAALEGRGLRTWETGHA